MFLVSKLSDWLTRATAFAARWSPVSAATREAATEARRAFAAAPAPLPFVDDAGVLRVAGTDHADVITLSLDAAAGVVNVVVNDVSTPVPLAGIASVDVNTGHGNDTVHIIETAPGEFTLPVALTGGKAA